MLSQKAEAATRDVLYKKENLKHLVAVIRRCSIEIGVLKNFTKFTGKHLCQSLFLNKVAGLRPATLLKKRTLAQVFSCEFCENFKNTFLQNTYGRMLLIICMMFQFFISMYDINLQNGECASACYFLQFFVIEPDIYI